MLTGILPKGQRTFEIYDQGCFCRSVQRVSSVQRTRTDTFGENHPSAFDLASLEVAAWCTCLSQVMTAVKGSLSPGSHENPLTA